MVNVMMIRIVGIRIIRGMPICAVPGINTVILMDTVPEIVASNVILIITKTK